MKIKLENILNLSDILVSLKRQRMSLKTSNIFYCLEEAIKPQLNFKQDKIQEIVEEFDLKPDENEIIHFDSPELQEQVQERLNELAALEVEINWEQKAIPLDENINIAPIEIGILKPFISFE